MLEEDRMIGDRKVFRWKAYYHNQLFARAFDGLAARHHTLGSGP